MTELDFDELDKAVNTIMSGMDTSKRREGLDDPVDTVVEIPSSSTDQSAGLGATPQPVLNGPAASENSSPQGEAPAPPAGGANSSAPLAIKRRGQFMDVMHSSSNMKSPFITRREGVSVQPSLTTAPAPDASVATENIDSTIEEAPVSQDEASPQPVVSDTKPSSVSLPKSEPTTIESVETIATPEAPKDADGDGVVDPSIDGIIAVPADVVEEVANPELDQPISSPFLADAKVEKRPLGTATPFPESVATPSPVVTDTLTTEPLPEELKADILELETSNTVGVASSEIVTPQKPAVSGSIPQQYTEQPSTSTVSNSAIYDTSTHHQPLDGGVKNASPMKWVILALVLLIVGALAGAAYFYLKTQ